MAGYLLLSTVVYIVQVGQYGLCFKASSRQLLQKACLQRLQVVNAVTGLSFIFSQQIGQAATN